MSELHASARDTESRLRNWLNGRQPEQEGMCLQLLPTLGPYTRCQPRRPKGGSDGGRDLQAVYDDRFETWGAVGFMNDASSSNGDRTRIARKFKADLARALQENGHLKGFVFFTNVDLTHSAKDRLREWARSQTSALEHVEIFDFEVMRSQLDCPEGLITRLQFLDIEMSKTEQVGLFSRYGGQMLSAMHERFDQIGSLMEKVERLVQFITPLSEISLRIDLSPPVSSGSEPLMCLVKMDSLYAATVLGDSSFAILFRVDERPELGLSVSSLLWNRASPQLLSATDGTIRVWSRELHEIAGRVFLYKTVQGTRVTVGNLLADNQIEVFANPALRRLVRHTQLTCNDYDIFNLDAPCEEHYELPTSIKWPSETADELAQTSWITLTRGTTFPSLRVLFNKR